MNNTTLQQYCLHHMGITQWRSRTACEYLICLEQQDAPSGQLSAEKSQTLDRIILALHWPKESVRIEIFTTTDPEKIKQSFVEKTQQYQPNKILLFGLYLEELLTSAAHTIGAVPTLTELITNPASKKQAWQTLQQKFLKCE